MNSRTIRLVLLVYVFVIIALYFTGRLTGAWWSIAIAVFLIGSGVMDIKDPRLSATKLAGFFSKITLVLGVVLLVMGVSQLFM